MPGMFFRSVMVVVIVLSFYLVASPVHRAVLFVSGLSKSEAREIARNGR